MENEIALQKDASIIEKSFTEDEIATIAEKSTRSSVLNDTLTTFVADICDQVRREDEYIDKLKEVALKEAQAGNLKPSELIALLTSATTNKNDLVSKTLGPTMGLLTAAQQNEMNERKEALKEKEKEVQNSSNIRNISNMAPSDVLIGLQALFTQTSILSKNKVENDSTATKA